VILPLEMGREFHENEYLLNGTPQSAKLIARRVPDDEFEFFVHIAFEFTPVKIETETVLGIDRGAAIIGSACVINKDGKVVRSVSILKAAHLPARWPRIAST